MQRGMRDGVTILLVVLTRRLARSPVPISRRHGLSQATMLSRGLLSIHLISIAIYPNCKGRGPAHLVSTRIALPSPHLRCVGYEETLIPLKNVPRERDRNKLD